MSEKQHTRVTCITWETEHIISVELSSLNTESLAPFSAGGHIDVFLPGNIVRQYSITNNCKEQHRYVISVLKETNSKGGSQHLHESLHVGDIIKVSYPRNNFPLIDNRSEHVFIAGGIGITPFISMISSIHHPQKNITLYYCTKNKKLTAFAPKLKKLLGDKLILHHDDGDNTKSINIEQVLNRHPGANFYCCGPRGSMLAMKEKTSRKNIPLMIENFKTEDPLEDNSIKNTRGFDILLSRQNITIRVTPEKTIIEAMRENNLDPETSCESGVCGTCIVHYLEGEPIHNDVILMPNEQKSQVAICVARCRSERLVLDI